MASLHELGTAVVGRAPRPGARQSVRRAVGVQRALGLVRATRAAVVLRAAKGAYSEARREQPRDDRHRRAQGRSHGEVLLRTRHGDRGGRLHRQRRRGGGACSQTRTRPGRGPHGKLALLPARSLRCCGAAAAARCAGGARTCDSNARASAGAGPGSRSFPYGEGVAACKDAGLRDGCSLSRCWSLLRDAVSSASSTTASKPVLSPRRTRAARQVVSRVAWCVRRNSAARRPRRHAEDASAVRAGEAGACGGLARPSL